MRYKETEAEFCEEPTKILDDVRVSIGCLFRIKGSDELFVVIKDNKFLNLSNYYYYDIDDFYDVPIIRYIQKREFTMEKL